ncbi:MAG: maleylpyruvate isomerase family mycothiol-dependent enzyme [Acidimicrobiales bacterium]
MNHVAILRTEGQRLSAAARSAGLDAPVQHCPGWSVGRLLGHTAKVLQRTNRCVADGLLTSPADELFTSLPRDQTLFDAFDNELATLCETFESCDPDGPSWNFSGENLTNAFWLRRMAHEVEIHRYDMQLAAGISLDFFDQDSAVDGIDELLTVLVPILSAEKNPSLSASFHLHCTDVSGEWLTKFTDGVPTTIREHAKGDLAVRGPASPLYAWAWNRSSAGKELTTAGDDSLLHTWATIVP